MFTLFNPPYDVKRTPVAIPMYEYLLKQIKNEMQKTIDFHQKNIYRIDHTTRIAKYVYELENHVHYSPENLVAWVRTQTHRLCGAYGFTSSISKGGIVDGELYNRNNPEVYISVEYELDIKKCVDGWQRLHPLKVICHDFTDFSYSLPNGKYISTERGLVVYTLDIAVLALQYQQWYYKERYVKEENIYLPHTHFIDKYVLCTLFNTHMDQVIFNRLYACLHEQKIPPTRSSNPYLTVDYGERLDDVHLKLISQLKSSPKDWVSTLSSIPAISRNNYYRSILYPDTAPTLNIKWAMVLSKVKVLEFLLKLDEMTQTPMLSSSDRYGVQVGLRTLKNDRSLSLFLPENVLSRIDTIYEKLSQSV